VAGAGSTVTATPGLIVDGDPPAQPPRRPAPLVGPWPHLLRFLAQKTHLLVVAVVLAYFGQLVIVALYYLLLETARSKSALLRASTTRETSSGRDHLSGQPPLGQLRLADRAPVSVTVE